MVKNSISAEEPAPRFNPDLVSLPERAQIDWSIHYLPVAQSTQELAREAARAGAAEGWTMVTDWQEAGRGRLGRRWLAAPGRDLLFSTLLRPPAPMLSLLPLLAGVALADALEMAAGVQANLKWPNDLLVEQRKLAGILLERGAGNEVLLGVGLNVNSLPPELPQNATSVRACLGVPFGRELLLGAILKALDGALARALHQESGWVVADFRRRSSMIGRRISYQQNGESKNGIAEDVDPDGSLRVRLDDGSSQNLYAGEVQLVRSQS